MDPKRKELFPILFSKNLFNEPLSIRVRTVFLDLPMWYNTSVVPRPTSYKWDRDHLKTTVTKPNKNTDVDLVDLLNNFVSNDPVSDSKTNIAPYVPVKRKKCSKIHYDF